MAIFAVIKENLVVNVIVAETKEIAEEVSLFECVDITNKQVGIGYTYTDGKFEPPYVEPVETKILPTDG
jgi:hypothetical protein